MGCNIDRSADISNLKVVLVILLFQMGYLDQSRVDLSRNAKLFRHEWSDALWYTSSTNWRGLTWIHTRWWTRNTIIQAITAVTCHQIRGKCQFTWYILSTAHCSLSEIIEWPNEVRRSKIFIHSRLPLLIDYGHRSFSFRWPLQHTTKFSNR